VDGSETPQGKQREEENAPAQRFWSQTPEKVEVKLQRASEIAKRGGGRAGPTVPEPNSRKGRSQTP